MLKKILFAVITLAAVAALAPAAHACDLSALTPGVDYDPAAAAKWTSPADQDNFCLARTLIKRVKAGETKENFTMDDLPVRMSRFVTPTEYDKKVRDVVSFVLTSGFSNRIG